MNWKQEAVDKLREFEIKKQALRSIPEEIRLLEEQMTAIRSPASDAPTRGGGNRRENMYLNNIVKRQELEQARAQAEGWVKLVEEGLNCLDEEERLVLDRLYLYPAKGNVERLCMELGCEKATVYRKREEALRRFTLGLYGCLES